MPAGVAGYGLGTLLYPTFELSIANGIDYIFDEEAEGEPNSCPDEPVGSLKKPKDKWLNHQGVDPHELKDGIGDSRSDICIDSGSII